MPLSERNDVTYLACIMLHLLAAQVGCRVWHVWHVGMDESTPITAVGVQGVFTKPVNSTSSKPNTHFFFFFAEKSKRLGAGDQNYEASMMTTYLKKMRGVVVGLSFVLLDPPDDI